MIQRIKIVLSQIIMTLMFRCCLSVLIYKMIYISRKPDISISLHLGKLYWDVFWDTETDFVSRHMYLHVYIPDIIKHC